MGTPIGSTSQQAALRRAKRTPEYAAELARLAPFEAIARLVIKHRMSLGITQQELADRIGTSHSAISRLESGQHHPTIETLQRVAAGLGLRFILGFESGPRHAPRREVVSA